MKRSKWIALVGLVTVAGVGFYYRFKRRAVWLLHSPSTSQPDCTPEQCNTDTIRVTGMKCDDCATTISDEVLQLDGVCECKVDFTTAKATVCYDPKFVTREEIETKIQDAGYGVQ